MGQQSLQEANKVYRAGPHIVTEDIGGTCRTPPYTVPISRAWLVQLATASVAQWTTLPSTHVGAILLWD